MKRARFIAPARREFLAEVAFYNEEEAELASRFATAVEEAVARAVLFPLTGLTSFDEYAPGLRGELSLLNGFNGCPLVRDLQRKKGNPFVLEMRINGFLDGIGTCLEEAL